MRINITSLCLILIYAGKQNAYTTIPDGSTDPFCVLTIDDLRVICRVNLVDYLYKDDPRGQTKLVYTSTPVTLSRNTGAVYISIDNKTNRETPYSEFMNTCNELTPPPTPLQEQIPELCGTLPRDSIGQWSSTVGMPMEGMSKEQRMKSLKANSEEGEAQDLFCHITTDDFRNLCRVQLDDYKSKDDPRGKTKLQYNSIPVYIIKSYGRVYFTTDGKMRQATQWSNFNEKCKQLPPAKLIRDENPFACMPPGASDDERH